ncbi:site-specific DNA-methyltransferase [Corynebacterium lizhenjunii]|uniref:Site-specific DNA-methyltransferase n=1 Tax=Corynebacterium lizhenjunii TaxID=2709394 RepID=A0A7T0KGS4_9CORY|nr:site-specific DNA-methyltransferase [Corynebacterium lizhenjunii]QPK79825.1 site-specific DNA-methyltransferase [Corynebacterium lizhenjunii]
MAAQRLQLTWYNKDKALIPTDSGKYGYTWVDPSDPRYCETRTLIYDDYVEGTQSPKTDEFEYSELADLEPQTDNLLILGESGDVLEALTRVPELAEKYLGKVKLIYIDPPFNTAQTFASYEDNLEHSVWLTMMRDRLLHMKKLLADDGSIWVHLDDVESHRMRLLLDEVFGPQNYVVSIEWEKAYAPSNNASGIPMVTDGILVYQKSGAFKRNKLPRSSAMDARYANPDGSVRGRWKQGDKSARHTLGKRQHPGVYGIQHPITGDMVYPAISSNWRFEQSEMLRIMREWGAYELGEVTDSELEARRKVEGNGVELRDDVKPLIIPGWDEHHKTHAIQRYEKGDWPIYYPANGGTGGFQRKIYLADVEGMMPKNLWLSSEVGHNDSAKREIQTLFPDTVSFTTPKPERLLERVIHIGSNPGDIVLDVFAGSGTTAAVAQKMGRKWVTCELLESTFSTFTRPRLEKVVRDEDAGGITTTKDRTLKPSAVLPEKFEVKDLQDATKLLNAIAKEDGATAEDAAAIKAVKRLLATGPSKTRNWRGGGGFHVAHLSPACFDYNPELDRVMLTPAATGQRLIESIAANLGFALLHAEDDYIFEGRRGNALLKVVEGVATVDVVDSLVPHAAPGETIVLAATAVMDGVRQHLRKAVKGSRVVALPDDLFHYSKGGEQ